MPHEGWGGMPLDTYITNLFEHSYEHWWCHRHHVKWRVTTLVIRSLFFLMTGCTQGYNQNPHPSPTPTPSPSPSPSPNPTRTPNPNSNPDPNPNPEPDPNPDPNSLTLTRTH